MKKLSFIFSVFLSLSAFAGPGDTVSVSSLNQVDMTWWGAYEGWGVFPDTSKTYRKILMHVTLGCATGGCSDWDYTVKIEGEHDGELFEMGRFMTPYGGYMANSSNGYNNNWQHTFTYEVTDYEQMLRDSVKIRAFYGGWSSGFSCTVDFDLIEGTPPRNVISMENLYQSGPGGWRSDNPDTFEINHAYALSVPIDSDAVMAMARVIPSGHGFVNAQNCAEFCDRDYYLKTDGVTRYTQAMWRDDCGLNPIFPQGGTWLYDRANWCPGDKTFSYDHELGAFMTPGSNLNIDLDLELYALTVPSGEVPPNYIIDAQLFQYEAPNFTTDAEITDIISPSLDDDYSRKNPICGKPVIEIRNGGANALTSLTITYGVKGATAQTFNWTGNLAFLEKENVALDVIQDWGSSSEFEVTLSAPNGVTDEYADNDYLSASFDPVPEHPNTFVVQVSTNAHADENVWGIYDMNGTIMASNGLDYNYTTYSDTITLDSGCYEFVLEDLDKDGLSFFANNDGVGGVEFRDAEVITGSIQDFPADFGTEIRHQFRVGTLPEVSAIRENYAEWVAIYPNPGNGHFTIKLPAHDGIATIEVLDLSGKQLHQESFSGEQLRMDVRHLPRGTYLVKVNTGHHLVTRKITIDR